MTRGRGGTDRDTRGKISRNHLAEMDNRSLCKEPRFVAGV
jgi:hypothetical protein